MTITNQLTITTPGRGFTEITRELAEQVAGSGVSNGLCSLFIRHTSASLTLCENADPQVLIDLERFMSRLVPDGHADFDHTAEGPDDMPAHVRSVLTRSDLTIPVNNSRLVLGTWQGVFLWEHRSGPHQRRIDVNILGGR